MNNGDEDQPLLSPLYMTIRLQAGSAALSVLAITVAESRDRDQKLHRIKSKVLPNTNLGSQ
ncbi:hypothetical protein BDZ89DRAFT_666442 [Hymenopellis radicata]|nr:hypothetical protein BDZ89DRAFT_666442 [Hymenopellis radicata]